MGVSRAAASLRQMVGEQVLLSVPAVRIVDRNEAAALVERGNSSRLVAVQQLFEGPFSGRALLIFPEGRRTQSGEVGRFQPGIGMIASRLEVPVVPVRLEGLDRILHHTAYFPTVGRGRCAFGAPISLQGNDYAALAAQVEAAVRAL